MAPRAVEAKSKQHAHARLSLGKGTIRTASEGRTKCTRVWWGGGGCGLLFSVVMRERRSTARDTRHYILIHNITLHNITAITSGSNFFSNAAQQRWRISLRAENFVHSRCGAVAAPPPNAR